MGVNAIFDTNIVIYLQKGLLARPLPRGEYLLSVISELELRSFHGLDAASQSWLNTFLSDITIVEDQRLLAIPGLQSESLELMHE